MSSQCFHLGLHAETIVCEAASNAPSGGLTDKTVLIMGLLSAVDTHFRPGSLGVVIVSIVAMCIVLVDIMIRPEDTAKRWMILTFGIVFTWRHFTVWQRRKRHGGLELIGTSTEVQQ
jgi:hypothetical protein